VSGARTRVVPTTLPLHVTEHLDEGHVSQASVRDHGQASGRDHGQAAEPTFVLLHGYAGSSYTWRYWAPRLTSRGRVLTVDLKGFGDAPKPEDGRYAPGDLADLVVALLRELDLRNVTLIGHSLGGGVALLTALRLHDSGEDRLARLVLIGSPAYRQKLPPLVPLSKVPGLTAPLLEMIGAKRAASSLNVLKSGFGDNGEGCGENFPSGEPGNGDFSTPSAAASVSLK